MRISDWSSDVCSSDLEIFIRLHFSEVRCLDSVDPFRPSRCALGEPLRHRRALVDVEQPARIGHAQRPGRHQHPPDDGEEHGGAEEPPVHSGDRPIEFLDAIPLMPGRHVTAVRIALCYRHGPSSRSEEHTSELQSLMRLSYAVFCLKKKNKTTTKT